MKTSLTKLNRIEKSKIDGNLIDVSRLILENIVEFENYILFEENINENTKKQMIDFPDKTSFEAFDNHIHVRDYVSEKGKGYRYLFIGLAMASLIKLKLQTTFPRKRFMVIVSYNIKTTDDCVIRFHKIRKKEGTWSAENLEGYKEEAVGIIEI